MGVNPDAVLICHIGDSDLIEPPAALGIHSGDPELGIEPQALRCNIPALKPLCQMPTWFCLCF